jgi:hypothetical protein
VSQLTLLVLLIPRFWRRGIVVAYYKHHGGTHHVQTFTPVPVVAPVVSRPSV